MIPKRTEEELKIERAKSAIAVEAAKKVLKRGDRVRCKKCPGTRRTFTFECWDGQWMVSKSGIDDFHPSAVDRVNGKEMIFYPDSL